MIGEKQGLNPSVFCGILFVSPSNRKYFEMNPLKSNLDQTDWAILRELQADARISYAELGRRVGLSSPAVQERVRRLEDAGVIAGYHASVNRQALNLPMMGIIRLSNVQTFEDKGRLLAILRTIPEVAACYHVTGEDEYVIHLYAQSIEHMTELKLKFAPYARLVTSIVIKSYTTQQMITLEQFPYLKEGADS